MNKRIKAINKVINTDISENKKVEEVKELLEGYKLNDGQKLLYLIYSLNDENSRLKNRELIIKELNKAIKELEAKNHALKDRIIKEQQETLKLKIKLSSYEII